MKTEALEGVHAGDVESKVFKQVLQRLAVFELVQLIEGIPAKVNLIPFNPWPGAPYERSSNAAIERFAEIVRRAGYPSPVCTPRGEDILAACGQLKSDSLRVPRHAAG